MAVDPPQGGRRSRLGRLSVRTRIALSVAVLTTAAVAISGLLVYLLESRQIRDGVYADIAQETAELEQLQCEQQPETAPQAGGSAAACTPRFASSSDLLGTFLRQSVPDDDELFVGWWDGGPRATSDRDGWEATVQEPGFVPAVRGLLPQGGSTTRTVPGVGTYLLTVQPVSRTAADEPDALLLVSYLDERRAALHRTMQSYAVATALLLLVVVGAAWLQAGRLLRPLRALRSNAEEITATDLARRLPVESDDDIGHLTRTYNSMLDRLEQGFEGQRQFLDDAGHELRTPLTVLRGHLEVVDAGDPSDVAETRALLLDEIERMSRLVDELILLAKSDSPGFLRPAATGVADLVAAVHRKAVALSADRTWVLGALPPQEASAQLDEQRVTQALLQLCDNAVKHTSPGDRISLAAVVTTGPDPGVQLTVTDTGAGVAPQDRTRIFERFGRAAVGENDEGFGLGLSIVRAIAEAHGGRAWVTDGPDGGASFGLDLPATAAAPDSAGDPDNPTQPLRPPRTDHPPSSTRGESRWPVS